MVKLIVIEYINVYWMENWMVIFYRVNMFVWVIIVLIRKEKYLIFLMDFMDEK